MRRFVALLILFAACTTATPVVVDDETRGTIAQLEQAIAQQPTNLPWIYVLATYYDRARDSGNVVKQLRRLDELRWEHGVSPNAFRNTNSRAFRDVVAKLEAREPRMHRAVQAFALQNQRDLVPEGIAYDPVDDVFYVTSIYRRKVLRVDRSGNASDFVGEGQDGMLGGLGVKVDRQRRLLWVISSTTPEMRGWSAGSDRSMLAAYDLGDGRLVRKIEATPALLNDLALLRDGSLFATHMGRNTVVRLAPNADAFEVWAEDFRFPNGIAVSDDERTLYVADFRGITRFALDDKSRSRIKSKALLNGIDGLSFHRGSLIGIQNAIGKPRIIRIDLATSVVEILEAKNALFEIPTGAVAGDDYFFIANPGLRSFDEQHRIWPLERLEDPVMLRIVLPNDPRSSGVSRLKTPFQSHSEQKLTRVCVKRKIYRTPNKHTACAGEGRHAIHQVPSRRGFETSL